MNELKRYKLCNDLTQKEISNKLGLTESKVSRLMKVDTTLKDVLTYSEYQTVINRLNYKSFYDYIELAVESAYGKYIPSIFCERYIQYIDSEIAKYFTNEHNIENDEYYIEEWVNFIDGEPININGTEYHIIDNEDLWLVPANIEIPEDFYI